MHKQDYTPVLTKRDFVRRFENGEFGNRGPMWSSVDQFLSEVDPLTTVDNLYHLRNRVAGGLTYYNVPGGHEIDVAYHTAIREGVKPENLYVAEMAPTDRTTIQGEVMQTERGLYLYYTKVRKPMRDALKEQSSEARGLTARDILLAYLDQASWEWLNILFERYPSHVIEFSTYNKCWGTIPNRNTVIWEVRNY